MMKRSSDNQNPMLSPNGSAHVIDYNNKKAKMDGSANKPSKVIHIRGVPSDVTDTEIIQLGLPFGRITNLVVSKKKNQALLEMADLASAQTMVNYYSERPPLIRDRTVHAQFSTYDHLKTENTQSQMAEYLIGNIDETKTVLRVIIDNMLYPITIDILKLIFSKYGQVLRIVTYTKNNSFQALIQYSDAVSAKAGFTALNNQNIYNGCCTLRIDYSHLQTLQVKYNNDKTWDYTNPNLPSGNAISDHVGFLENCGDGILGSYNGALNNFGIGSFSGNQNLSKVGVMTGMSGGISGGIGMGGAPGMSGLAGLNNILGIGAGLLGGAHQPTNTVLIVSNLNEEKVTPDYLFTLFGVYGMVTRVKIMYNKKDTALVQFSDPLLAQNAVTYLDKIKWWGKTLKVSISKHSYIQMPKEGQAETWLTKDYTNSKLHRHSNPNSKNYGSINPPSSTLHIANIPNSMTEDELADLFNKHGSVEACKFLEKEKKMALVQMVNMEEAVGALVELHNHQLPGPHYLRVSFTKSTI